MEQLYSLSLLWGLSLWLESTSESFSLSQDERKGTKLLHSLRRGTMAINGKVCLLHFFPLLGSTAHRSKPNEMHTKKGELSPHLAAQSHKRIDSLAVKSKRAVFCFPFEGSLFFRRVQFSVAKLVASGRKFCVAEKPQLQEENEKMWSIKNIISKIGRWIRGGNDSRSFIMRASRGCCAGS